MDGKSTEADREHIRRCLALAEGGWGQVAPNPLVGAVVVRDGVVVGEGYHTAYGRSHAEIEALRAAGSEARGATLYVSLEPCSHHGKTPPCTQAVIAAGVRRLVFGAADPNPRAAGGAAILREAGIEVVGEVEAEAVRDQNAPFFHRFSSAGAERPWIELKLALSLDARLADREGRSAWITGEAARAEVHRLRAGADAIAVGIGTVLADDPRLTVRGPIEPRRPPVRVIFDHALRLPPGSRLARTASELPVRVIAGPEVPRERRQVLERLGVRVLPALDLDQALSLLREEGIESLLCEGGAVLASALLEADVVDRITLFYAPLLLGPEGRSPFAGLPSRSLGDVQRWRRLRTANYGADTLITVAR